MGGPGSGGHKNSGRQKGRTRWVYFGELRCTPDELPVLLKAFANSGMKSKQAFVRKTLMEALKPEKGESE